ncbi:DUF3320 domain-containing protein [Fundidesulfovibrio butyratiphilus]
MEETIFIDVSTLPKLNLALQQNAVPLIQDLGIKNNTREPLERVELVLQSDPPVCQQQVWRVECVGPEVHYRLPERALNISAKYLSELREAVRAVLSFRLTVSGQEVCAKDVPLEVLSKDEWGGVGHIPEIAAAFVRPNDVAVERIIKQAAEVLRKRSKPSAFDGYTTGDRKRVWEVLSSIWASVCSLGLDYILPPASFEQLGQKVRSPSRVLEAGLGTCLDLCLLFASCIEQCGLNPLLVFLDGHAFPGAWLSDEDFSTAVVDDPLILRKRIELGEMVLFESTLAVTERPAPPFSFACQTGAGHLDGPKSFLMAVDVKRARIQRIKPLDEARPTPVADAGPAQVQEPVWEEAPDLPESIDLPSPDAQADLPGGRLEKWKRQLLDLSLRNKLLNFKPGKTAIFLNCPAPARLEDMLADGERFKILPDPRVMLGNDPRSQELHRQQNQEEARLVHARQALERKELLADGPGDQLDGRLVELFRAVRSQLEEGGANTLYLAIGILNWKKDQTSERTHKAPLILIPVILHRRSVQSGFTLTMHEDTPRFNPTLLQMLRQDHALSMTEFEGDLPTDESGLDIPLILRTVRQHVRDIPGWSVSDGVVLATFSFSKYLMWKDLADRTDQLKENPIVRHLIDTPREPYGSADDFPRAEDLDDTLPAQECFTPLMSDSSQLAAVAAASRGKDFVLVGPPGTGKSQTITNIIAQCLAMGQSVLFVSEKKAALDVVHRRLRDVGLSDFCLELHSNKANKVEALNQLRAACDASEIFDSSEWERESHRLQSLRSQLNAFVRRLHHRHPNGLSAYQAMGHCIAGGHVPWVNLSWPDAHQHDADAMGGLRDVARRIGITSRAVGEIAGHPLTGLSRGEWSPSWQTELLEEASTLPGKATTLLQAGEACRKAMGLPATPSGRRGFTGLTRLAKLVLEAYGKPYAFLLSPGASLVSGDLRKGVAVQADFQKAWSGLSVPYQMEASDLDLDGLSAEWEAGNSAWWLKRVFACRGVRNALKSKTEGKENPRDIPGDIELLRRARGCLAELSDLDHLQGATCGLWRGLDTAAHDVEAAFAWGDALRAAMSMLADTPDELAALRLAIARVLELGEELLSPEGMLRPRAKHFEDASRQFEQSLKRLTSLTGTPQEELFPEKDEGWLESIGERCRAWRELAPKIKNWCAWRGVRQEAVSVGLSPLITALESLSRLEVNVPELFEVNYCRWWLQVLVDDDEVLRSFVSHVHEGRIDEFRKLDETIMGLTKSCVRARLCGRMAGLDDKSRKSETGILNRELQKKKRHMPLRQLITALPNILTRVTPCFLMSPLSIAQFLSAQQALFDVVVFDEASQIPVWDAIGAIARGRRLVVAGDPKQLPPTSFFDRRDQVDVDGDDVDEDMESILDECMGANLPTLQLRWHYRSKSESLITFSNHRYYGGGLVTFPTPATTDRAIHFYHVPEGVYEKGGARVNRAEAKAVVEDIVKRLRDPAFNKDALSLGVVTFNQEQQRLIEDLLEVERRKDPAVDAHFSEDRQEPVFVKNLENVQGDERDVILFSVTYGPDASGRVSMNFGPLNKSGGGRRLNVAVTRARQEMSVFSTLSPDQIDLSRTSADGVKDFKHFLEYAERGPKALGEAIHGALGGYDSPFEKSVAERLQAKGWTVHTQIGVSAFRIDLGVVHPDMPGRYLAGVECDGATYHRSATARDRDRLRQLVLNRLGWNIFRVWSTDWWTDSAGALDKLQEQLSALLEQTRQSVNEEPATLPMAQEETPPFEEPSPLPEAAEDAPLIVEAAPASPGLVCGLVTQHAPPRVQEGTTPDEDSSLNGARERFHDLDYTSELKEMVSALIASEGPIREDLLVRKIARAHGLKHSGERIKNRVLALVSRTSPKSHEESMVFYWPEECEPSSCTTCRLPGPGEETRSVDSIAIQELVVLARQVLSEGVQPEEAHVLMGARLGLKRLRQPSVKRLQSAIKRVLDA